MSDLDWKALLNKPPEPDPPPPPPEPIQGINLYDIGNSIQLAGAIYSDDNQLYLLLLPGESMDMPSTMLELSLDEWKRFIRQTDVLETEVLARSADGKIAKAIMRKSQRQIDTAVSWAVFRRDGYACRYCGADDAPLTVDHLVLWEDGGPSIEENLVAACRKCNKIRANTQYVDWLKHRYYLKVSKSLPPTVVAANTAVLATLDAIPRQRHKKSR